MEKPQPEGPMLDLKAACRELWKNRSFTCVTVLTLALGIGANTAIFAVVNRVLLNPLPYPDSERLVYLALSSPRTVFDLPTPPAVAKAWREEARSVDGVEAFEGRTLLAYDDRGARVVSALRITPSLPTFLGVAPVLGRSFVAADAEPGAPPVVLLSYRVWQGDYGGAIDVIGRAITLDDVPHVVVGVMPAGWDAFSAGSRDVWLPLIVDAAALAGTDFRLFEVLARLRPDVPRDAVRAELDALAARALGEMSQPMFGATNLAAKITTPADRVSSNTRQALFVLLGAVGLVLLVACSNVANLLLARGVSRARELALCSALGASTWRLVRALFAECLVLALTAGAVGVAVGWLLLHMLARLRPDSVTALTGVRLDTDVLAFTIGMALVTALLFGVAPAWQLRAPKLADTLRHGGSGVMRGGSGVWLRKLLVAAQMALSVVLLVSSGLLIRSFIHLQNVDLGFDPRDQLSVELALPRGRYQAPASRDTVADQLIERVRALPGVVSVTQAFIAPPYDASSTSTSIEIRGVAAGYAENRTQLLFNKVRPDYFAALGIPLLEGRTFTADELTRDEAVIVDRAAAQRFWPDGRALGTEVKIAGRDQWLTVVGVVDNVASAMLTLGRDEPHFYYPLRAASAPTMVGAPPTLTLIVRAAREPADVIVALRAAVKALDPEIAIPGVTLTEDALGTVLSAPRFNMALLVAFAVVALLLAAVGLAAVIGYEITERTHEIGVRMALGARAANVRRLAMRQGLVPAFVGVVVGVLGALGATQLVAGMLHGVAPRDPLTFVAVVALLALVAVAASWQPARRATRVDPITALRAE